MSMDNSYETPSGGYSKRPLWQWVAIYVVVAIVVYGLFYYFVMAKRGGYNSTTPASTDTTSPNSY